MNNFITDFMYAREAKKHEELKAKINALQIEKNFAEITKHPQAEIDRYADKLKRLQKKLNRGR